MKSIVVKRFESPDETRTFKKGRFELVAVGKLVVGRAAYAPGWKWSTHVAPMAGTHSCQVEHVGLVVSGRCKVAMLQSRRIAQDKGFAATDSSPSPV
jgi:hypothetical protein